MRAMVAAKFGPPDVLRIKEVEKPVPKDNEVLIRVRAASVNPFDWRYLRADPVFLRLMDAGLLKPKHKIPGADIAGQVEAAGVDAKEFRPGDEVFGNCRFGGFAEYACADGKRLARKPAGLSFEEAAAVPIAGITALQGLRDKGRIQAGQKVLINGASGGVGTYAVQIAKACGAEVTGVCSTAKLDLVRSIGADHVVDYTREDVTLSRQRYDLILDAAAYRSVLKYKRIMGPQGIYVLAGGAISRILQVTLVSMMGVKRMIGIAAKIDRKDLLSILELIEAGKVRSIIGKRYPLSETAEALRDLMEGRARGKVVITV